MRLEHAFTYRTAVAGPHVVGDGPHGLRHIYEMTGGSLEGPRLTAKTLGAGADWMLVGADGVLRMDVRLQFATGDGALLCVRYRGVAEADERLREALSRCEPTDFGDSRIRSWWQLECGDPRYGWVNRSVFVGEGRALPAGPGVAGFEHRVHRAA